MFVKGGGILYWVVRGQLTEKVTFEQRPEGGKGVNHEDETLRRVCGLVCSKESVSKGERSKTWNWRPGSNN